MRDDLKRLFDDNFRDADVSEERIRHQLAGVCKQPYWNEAFRDYGIDAAITEYLANRKTKPPNAA